MNCSVVFAGIIAGVKHEKVPKGPIILEAPREAQGIYLDIQLSFRHRCACYLRHKARGVQK